MPFEGLRGLDPVTLEDRWSVAEDFVRAYASVIASPRRAYVTSEAGDRLLVGFDATSARVLDRQSPDRPVRTLAHPAVAGDRLYRREGRELICERLRF